MSEHEHHHSHEKHGKHSKKDPVCEMSVDPDTAEHRSEHAGTRSARADASGAIST